MKLEHVLGRQSDDYSQPNAAGEPNWPKNLIHEQSRSEPSDPPNLQRLTWRESLEDSSIVEWVERLRGREGEDTCANSDLTATDRTDITPVDVPSHR